MMRDKRVLGGVAAVIAIGFIAALAASVAPNDPKPSPTPSASPTPSIDPITQAMLDAPSSCAKDPGTKPGETVTKLETFEDPSGFRVISGDATVGAESAAAEGDGAIVIDAGQSVEETVLERELPDAADVSRGSIRIWIRQNGNLASPGTVWRVRLLDTDDDYFERVFSTNTISDAIRWCRDDSVLADWRRVGGPDPSALVRLRVAVPGYAGAGAGNRAWFDALSVARGAG